MDLQLAGKSAILVGGCGSIGRATATALTAEGAHVLLADRATAHQPDLPWPQVELDATSEADVHRLFAALPTPNGRVDILINLVGVYEALPVTQIDEPTWDRMLAINLRGMFLACREGLPRMQASGFGRIICLASLAGQVGGVVVGAHYAAAKAGVLSLVKSLARQSRPAGAPHADITVNAVSPGPVESAMTATWTPAERERMLSTIPKGRFARPEEIADVIAFLASPRAGYLHGTRIDVNGGALMA
jgi:NAD(P)-dependent dehydrogenase (short-subunit alcohol dehydrogenase family)